MIDTNPGRAGPPNGGEVRNVLKKMIEGKTPATMKSIVVDEMPTYMVARRKNNGMRNDRERLKSL